MINRMMEKHKILADDEVFINIDDNDFGMCLQERNETPANIHCSTTISDLGKKLLLAAQEGDPDEIRQLLANGAPLSADWLGTSPLHLAAQNNHLEACELFLAAGLCKDSRTKVDRTPLHMAATEGLLEVTECLLKHGADPDAKDMLHMTPLHWAVQNGHAEVAAMLIRNGAAITTSSKFDLTPLDIALQINRSDLVQIINYTIRDPLKSTERMHRESSEVKQAILQMENDAQEEPAALPIETILLDANGHIAAHVREAGNVYQQQMLDDDDPDQEHTENEAQKLINDDAEHSFTESMKYLQQHGITILPDDESSILNTVMEAGHSVVLTEAGKQVLESFKTEKPQTTIVRTSFQTRSKPTTTKKKKKIITVTADQFLAMTANGGNGVRVVNGKLVPNKSSSSSTVRRIVMKKNKVQPIQHSIRADGDIAAEDALTTHDGLVAQLQKSHQLVRNYKQRLIQSELELQKYKRKCKMLTEQIAQKMLKFDI